VRPQQDVALGAATRRASSGACPSPSASRSGTRSADIRWASYCACPSGGSPSPGPCPSSRGCAPALNSLPHLAFHLGGVCTVSLFDTEPGVLSVCFVTVRIRAVRPIVIIIIVPAAIGERAVRNVAQARRRSGVLADVRQAINALAKVIARLKVPVLHRLKACNGVRGSRIASNSADDALQGVGVRIIVVTPSRIHAPFSFHSATNRRK
jgi:hypothetical protein